MQEPPAPKVAPEVAPKAALEAAPAVSPVELLLNYDLSRTNKTLAIQLEDARKTIEEAESRVESMTNSINNLILILTSISSDTSKLPDINNLHLLRPLILQFKNALQALKESSDVGPNDINNNNTLTSSFAELKRLCAVQPKHTPALSEAHLKTFDSQMQAQSSDATPLPENSTHSQANSVPIKSEMRSSTFSPEAVTDAPQLFPQHCRTLKEYLVDAKIVREFHKLHGTYDEVGFIEEFIHGLEHKIYQRRIIHILRKEGWGWNWVYHTVIQLLNEEAYFRKQSYALAHRQPDGSVILPDGTRQYGFLILDQITDADLTTSDTDYVEG